VKNACCLRIFSNVTCCLNFVKFIRFYIFLTYVLPFDSEEAVKRSGNPNVMMKNPGEMESQVFSKAKSRVSVLFIFLGF